MRLLSYILMLLGIYLLAVAAYQEIHGRTTRPAMFLPFTERAIRERRHSFNNYIFSVPVLKRNNPQLFREFMTTHWVWAALILGGGVVLNARDYRLQERDTSA
jgi:hypothetical protein